VTAESIRQAYLWATGFEWRCRQAYHIEALGGAKPMDPKVAWRYGELFRGNDFTGLFEAMARIELRHDPSILE
jgi:L-fuculose-phosphate aldolase